MAAGAGTLAAHARDGCVVDDLELRSRLVGTTDVAAMICDRLEGGAAPYLMVAGALVLAAVSLYHFPRGRRRGKPVEGGLELAERSSIT